MLSCVYRRITMKNLCHFDIVINDERLPAAEMPIKFEPILAGEGPVRTLMGYSAPDGVDDVGPAGDRRVIVPRFAAAIAWALAIGLEPLTVPQRHLGDRGHPGAPELVVESVEELEPAPVNLAYEFAHTPFDGTIFTDLVDHENGRTGIAHSEIQRMIQGQFPIIARGIGTFESVAQGARDLPDGTAELPDLAAGALAVIVPNSGPCVRAAQALGVAVLVTGVPDPVTKEVDLYRVA